MPRLLVFLAVLLPALAFAVEIPLTPPVLGPAADVQFQSLAASDGDSYFVIWTDDRTRNRETWGARVSRDGVLLDPTGIRLFEGEMRSAQLIWTGTSYLVVWASDNNMWMLRVDRDGNVIDPARAIVAGATPASIAKSASQVVIGYQRGNEVHALFVTPDGRPIVDLLLPARDEQHAGPQVAWTGLHFVAIWTSFGEPSRVEGVRFGQAGALDREPRVLVTGGAFQRVRLASDGTNLAMLSSTDFTGMRHFVRRVSGGLTSVGPAVELPDAIQSDASIVWTGTNYVVTGASGAVTSGVRLDAEARLIDANAIRIAEGNATGSSAAPSIASNGRDLFVVWTGRIGSATTGVESDVFGALASPATLVPRSQDVLAFTARRQSRPTITNGTSTLLALWSDREGLWAKRLARNGASIDATPIRVHDKEGVAQATFNGTNFIIAWTDSREIRTFRIPEAGALRADAAGAIAAFGGSSLALASNAGTTALFMSGNALRIAELGADASFITAPRILANGIVGPIDVAVAQNTFFVVWGEMEFLPPTFETAQPRRVLGTRLGASLINMHPAPIVIADTPAFEGEPSVAWDGRQWVVVWTEGKSVLRARFVWPDGNLIGNEFFVASNAMLPDVAWDGQRYVIAWVGMEDGFPATYRAAWISRFGAAPLHAVELGDAERRPPPPITVTPIAPGDVALTYARLAHESGSVARAFVTIGRPPVVRRRAVR